MSLFRVFGAVGVLVASTWTMGCSPLGADLVRDGDVRLNVRQSEHVNFTGVSVRQSNGGAEVSGIVRARLGGPRPIAKVHVEVVDETGRVITESQGKLRGQSQSPRHHFRSTFRIELPVPPPPDSTVVVWYGSSRTPGVAGR